MAPVLGKRKHRTREAPQEDASGDESSSRLEEDAQAVFKRYFEAQFKPLPEVKKKAKAVVEEVVEEGEEDDSDWDGITDDEEAGVQVVEHSDLKSEALMSKAELKKFMSSKPPVEQKKPDKASKSTSTTPNDSDDDDKDNLKKDLALQRLLAESHLLDSSTVLNLNSSSVRHKATDLRLQALGAKTSILTQEKMPLSHRKGIVAKKKEKEEFRRREARENGIILEKVSMKGRGGGERKRERGVGGPGVGKLVGGTLRLSKKDIYDIEGPKGRGGGGKGGRGGKRPNKTRR